MANTLEDFQKFGKAQLETASASSQSVVKVIQAIIAETTEYSKKRFANGSAFLEKLLGAKSFESAIQLQSEYAKSAYADFVAESAKLGELYQTLAKEAFKPLEAVVAKVQPIKD